MISRRTLLKGASAIVATSSVAAMNGCGTILYPDRRGQTGGRIDIGVALLDAIGLLFFIIPGVIAFAVDFSTGAIYLPGTSHAQNDNAKEITKHLTKVDPKDLSPAQRRIVQSVISKVKERGHAPASGELRIAGRKVRVLALNEQYLDTGTRLAMNQTTSY